MFKYHCLNPIADIGLTQFSDEYVAIDKMENVDAVLVRSAAMHDLQFDKELKVIARAGAGVNNIPLERCAEEGIVVFNTPGANANGVKELVIAGMLMASRDIIGGINWVQEHEEDGDVAKTAEKAKKAFAGCELEGKKLGVIGLGAIGVLVANTAYHLGMDVYGYDPYISVNAAWNLSRDIKQIEDVTEIYKNCDYITVHVPLMDATKKMINKEAFAMMKDGVVILNFARDLLVDEEAILEAIAEGKVKKYVSDFANPTTAGKDGVILTPHLGASTEESEDNCAIMAVEEIKDFMENGNIKNSVNYPACDMGVCAATARVTICHKNVSNMIGKFTSVLGDAGINIAKMASESRGEYAYTMLDVDAAVSADVAGKLEAIEGVLKVRVL